MEPSPSMDPSHQQPVAKKPKVDRHFSGSKITFVFKGHHQFLCREGAKVEASLPPPNNKLSARGMVEWLLEQAAEKIKGLGKAVQNLWKENR